MPKELKTNKGSIRVHNFWLNGATGEVQAVLVHCVDGEPTNEFFDMPRMKFSEEQLDALQVLILQHGQAADKAKKAEADALIESVKKENAESAKEAAKARAKMSKDELEAAGPVVERPLPAEYKRLLPDGAIK